MESADDLKELVELFEGVRPEKVVFWTGAGISCASPTNLPDGDTLTVECMKKFMPEDVANDIKKIFKEFYKNLNKKEAPRLELIIQNVYDVLGQKAFDYFKFMDISECLNSYHSFFSQHILAGGTHFTMNFDNGIEKSGKLDQRRVIDDSNQLNKKDFEFAGKLIKLHGSLTNEKSYASLGLILRRITCGFGKEESENVHKVIKAAKVLCFIGYSGRDAFDVAPFFRKYVKNTRLNDLTVVWIKRAKNQKFKSVEIAKVEDPVRTILDVFYDSGARVRVYEGDAECGLIPHLTDKWKLECFNSGLKNVKTTSCQWKEKFEEAFRSNPVPHDLKKLIAGECAQSLGLGQLAVNCTESIRLCNLDTHPSDGGLSSLLSHQGLCWFIYTDGLRNLGKFELAISALRKWKQKASGDPFNIFLIDARLMGEYRLKGDIRAICCYLGAKRYFNKYEKCSDLLDRFIEPDKKRTANDFIAKLYVDRLYIYKPLWKLLRWFCWKKRVVNAWIATYDYNKNGFCHPHTFAELENFACNQFVGIGYDYFVEKAKKKLGPKFDKQDLERGLCPHEEEEGSKSMQEIEAFLETDSLLGVINSKRWQIDEQLRKKQPNDKELMNKIEEVEENSRKAELINDYGVWIDYKNLARVHKMPPNEIEKVKEYTQKALDAMEEADYSFVKKVIHSTKIRCMVAI